jgi:hypothetical protein
MPEEREDLDALVEQRLDAGGDPGERRVVVGRLAKAQVSPTRFCVQIADPDCVPAEPGLDSVPRVVTQVEGEPHALEPREQQLEQRVVARAFDDDANAAEPIAQLQHSRQHDIRLTQCESWCLDGEAEAVGNLPGPASELLGGGQAVAGRVQLHRVQALRVEAQELFRSCSGRVEPRSPRWVGPAGSTNRKADYTRAGGRHG